MADIFINSLVSSDTETIIFIFYIFQLIYWIFYQLIFSQNKSNQKQAQSHYKSQKAVLWIEGNYFKSNPNQKTYFRLLVFFNV